MPRVKLRTVQEVLDEFAGRPLAELEAAYQSRVADVQDIQAQLGDPARKVDAQWRASALTALRYKLEDQRVLKLALKQARQAWHFSNSPWPLDSPEGLLKAADTLLRRLCAEGVELEDEEQALLNSISKFFEARRLNMAAGGA